MILWVVAILFFTIILLLYLSIDNSKRVMTPTVNQSKQYLVREHVDAPASATMLEQIDHRIQALLGYLSEHGNQYPEYVPYIDQLLKNGPRIKLTEASPKSRHTSYTINKGEEIAICLRDPQDRMHDINTIMYVTIHELAHVACPEVGHTPLFREIFVFLLKISIQIGIYNQVNYQKTPQAYCGIVIRENLLQ